MCILMETLHGFSQNTYVAVLAMKMGLKLSTKIGFYLADTFLEILHKAGLRCRDARVLRCLWLHALASVWVDLLWRARVVVSVRVDRLVDSSWTRS